MLCTSPNANRIRSSTTEVSRLSVEAYHCPELRYQLQKRKHLGAAPGNGHVTVGLHMSAVRSVVSSCTRS
jgi:hypothetical protein